MEEERQIENVDANLKSQISKPKYLQEKEKTLSTLNDFTFFNLFILFFVDIDNFRRRT